MKFEQYFSSSKGNLYTVTADSGHRLIIECGVPWKKLQKAMNYDLTNIDGCLVTHEHQDHAKAVKEVMVSGIDVYASQGTLKQLDVLQQRRARVAWNSDNQTNSLFWQRISPDFEYRCYLVSHDAAEPLLWLIRCDGKLLLFVIDTSVIRYNFKMAFSVIAIGCNYDRDILLQRFENKDIHPSVAKRILTSHMEEGITIDYLQKCCDLSKLEELHLLHLSEKNIDIEKVKAEIEKKLFIKTIVLQGTNHADIPGQDNRGTGSG